MTAETDDVSGISRRAASLLFACLLGSFCLWVLSLPLFPTQDGPMHKYYVHVLASLLSGSHAYSDYAIRHPLPPYATHYAVLLGLTRVFSYDLAEKFLVCLIFVCTAYGVRYCAQSFGANGAWLSLCAVPLVLHWSLVMGFLNYSLGLGLFFFAAGLWSWGGNRRQLWWFVLVSVLLALTHPIPLLLLIVFCLLDLAIRLAQRFSVIEYRRQYVALTIVVLCFLYPLASVDRSRSAANLRGFGLHRDALISSLALFGISPFDTRAKNLMINGYRLGLCALLVACVILAAEGLRSRWKAGQLRSSDSMLFLAIAVLVAIPVLPASMNGSDFFSQRLLIFPWFGAIVAASATKRSISRIASVFAVLLTVLTLLPAEIFIRPVARQLATLEHEPLPQHAGGLALMDPAMLKEVRVDHQIGFNPYLWSGALPLLSADDIMLNSPFMDQKITPLMPTPGGDLLIDRMSTPEEAERVINGNLDLPSMRPELRVSLLASTRVVVLVGVPADVQRGLGPLVGDGVARHYACTNHQWYLVCTVSP